MVFNHLFPPDCIMTNNRQTLVSGHKEACRQKYEGHYRPMYLGFYTPTNTVSLYYEFLSVPL